MKILMLTPYLPYPLHSGGQTRSYNLIKNLAKDNEITLFSFIRKDEERQYLPQLKKFCKTVELFKRRPAWSPVNVLLSGITFYPFLVCIYLSKELRQAISRAIEIEKFDLIHTETFYVMPNIPSTTVPTILVEQTIEYMVYKHFVDEFKYKLLKPFLLLDVFKIRFWETHFWKKASRVIAVSESDKKEMLKLAPSLKIDIVPNGVDTEWFTQGKFAKKHPPTVLYIGNFKWLQNVEAVEILVHQVWPQIKRRVKNAKLRIVGRGMDDRVHVLKAKSIDIDESVEDIRQAYQNADLIVTPIEGPGGTRLKILESMASGVPVVSTSVGVEGLKVRDSREVFICDDYQAMGVKAAELLKNPQKAQAVAASARNFVFSNYSWLSITRQLENTYTQAQNSTPFS